MANGAPGPGRKRRSARPDGTGGGQVNVAAFNADARSSEREKASVTIGGLVFTRRKKDWDVNQAMRAIARTQESLSARRQRLTLRIAEVETEQAEAAIDGNDEREADLEAKIEELVRRADESSAEAELASYRLLALLLVPAAAPEIEDDADEDDPRRLLHDEAFVGAFGLDEDRELQPADVAEPAIEFFQEELDVEDAAALAGTLTGSVEPDPPTAQTDESS